MHVQEYKSLQRLYKDRFHRKEVVESLGGWAPRFLSQFRGIFDVFYPDFLDTAQQQVEYLYKNEWSSDVEFLLLHLHSNGFTFRTGLETVDSSLIWPFIDSSERRQDLCSATKFQEELLNIMTHRHGPKNEGTGQAIESSIYSMLHVPKGS